MKKLTKKRGIFMKNLKIIWLLVIFTVLPISAYTSGASEQILRNSYGYDHTKHSETNDLLLEKRPDWFRDNWGKWKESREKDGIYQYFIGESNRPFSMVIKENKQYWTQEDATKEAWNDATKKVSYLIETKIKDEYREKITASTNVKGTQQGITAKELIDQQAQEIMILESSASSSSSYRWLTEADSFSETKEQTKGRKQKRVAVTSCWIVFRIPNSEIETAMKRISEDRERQINESSLETRLIANEEAEFNRLSKEYDVIKTDLNNYEISMNEELYGRRYEELQLINARLRTLDRLKNRDDNIGQRYSSVLQQIGDDILVFNPRDSQKITIENLRGRIREQDALLDELRDKRLQDIIASRQGYSLQTQTTIISYPQRPREIQVPSVNIFAAGDMVTNMDFISFANINGINNLSRANNGLYSPVTSVTWNDAARYCNWLSRLYNYEPCYDETGGRITGYNNKRNGFRLPEENEIIAVLQAGSGIINQKEFSEIGIWCSSGSLQSPLVLRLSGGTGTTALDGVMFQSIDRVQSDREIGFRVVRNAR